MREFLAGIDVGSTTVKTVVRSPARQEPLFLDYRRHESRQAATVLQVLKQVRCDLGIADNDLRLFMTGSGGQRIAEMLGARFVQEVAAVSLAVEKFHPDARSVIELGGQDAKMIFFIDSGVLGRSKKIATMNDKCAGGTGVVIEKIASKLHIPLERLQSDTFKTANVYPVAGKCGVFAETDITGLQKQGVPVDDLMASLFHAIVLQNLSVLTRGNTLMPKVLLLGGPLAYFPGLQEAWRRGLMDLWQRKNVALPEGAAPGDLVVVPRRAEFFAALGAIEFGCADTENRLAYQGTETLETHVRKLSNRKEVDGGECGLCTNEKELEIFRNRYSVPGRPAAIRPKSELRVFVGLDGGSTSTKAVALSEDGNVVASAYRISQSDPITDAIAVLCDLRTRLQAISARVNVLAMATTGYSKDLLRKVFRADLALVETVAHAKSSLRVRPDVDAIIDVGGQDIKIMMLQDGAVKDFKLNTQCSAGNGYFLQAAAESLGFHMEDFADAAFRARRMPQFSYGCAVFLQSDIVNFQRQGWQPEEILAGLAAVLPKNVFLYVAGLSNVANLGRRFVLQGGTQRNLAVVKAEVDFIREHYHGVGEPEIVVHPNCSEAGAIGAALEAIEFHARGNQTSFPGFQMLDTLEYTISRDESTRCDFCTNRCLRTFVEIGDPDPENSRRIVIASCERGEAESTDAVRKINQAWKTQRQSCPNFVQLAGEQAWKPWRTDACEDPTVSRRCLSRRRSSAKHSLRSQFSIGIPKALNLFTYAPLFTSYFENLGILPHNLRFSHFSNPEMYKQASGFSAIDPCFPSKVTVAHVYELLQSAKTQPLDAIFFPMFDVLTTSLEGCAGSNACPSGSATPEAVKAAFSRTVNWFREANVQYVSPVVNLADRDLFKYQMFSAWKDLLQLEWKENSRAVDTAFTSWESFEASFRERARQTLERLEDEGEIGLVMLGRPYHHDPGLNQRILEELQRMGYPIFSQSLLPLDADLLDRLFSEDLAAGLIRSPLEISDVWKHSFSGSSNQKIWAAKFAARHPNLVSVELSNFKCGHDAFISRLVEQIIEQSGKPHFAFRDLDENRPLASIRIRVETIHYFLRTYRDRLRAERESHSPTKNGGLIKHAGRDVSKVSDGAVALRLAASERAQIGLRSTGEFHVCD